MVPTWTIGDRMRKAREHAGLTVEAMADALNVNRRTIARWEHQGSVPRTGLMAYALQCEVPIEWLETGDTVVTRR